MSAPILRLMTCGSVDDGKSTLLGRLLHDAELLHDDQKQQLAIDSRRHGTAGDALDYALLLDGLEAEREQGITIDVAYRYVTTQRRRLIIADAPGHAQYTRNMATAASVSDLAILLVDAQQGLLAQTRRHSAIAALMGVRHIVLAINKMDLMAFSQDRFNALVAEYCAATAESGFETVQPIPLSARFGDNVTSRSARTAWYQGPSLLDYLEQIDIAPLAAQPFRMPVQWVNRPHAQFRGYAGTIATGTVSPGDTIIVSDSGQTTQIDRIVTQDGDLPIADSGRAVTLVLRDELDISRGAVISTADHPVTLSDQFSTHLIWLADTPLLPGRSILFKLGTRTISGTVTRVRHVLDIETGTHEAADTVPLNGIAKVQLSLSEPVAFAPYRESRALGGFLMIDRLSNATIGVGMIDHELTRAANIRWQELSIDRSHRAALKGQKPVVVWFTGLSGAGKSTIADLVDRQLYAMGRHSYVLDGDNVRHGLNRDLGFTETDRVENIRRVGDVAALFADAGLIVLVSFISPYRADRDMARSKLPPGELLEVFVDTPIDECRRRDPKGLYARADAGKIANFTGVSAPYEPPLAPDLHLHTTAGPAEDQAAQVIALLRGRGFIS